MALALLQPTCLDRFVFLWHSPLLTCYPCLVCTLSVSPLADFACFHLRCPDPGLPCDFHSGWEGGVGTRIAVRNTCSMDSEAGQQASENIAEWMGLPHHKSRNESCTKSRKPPSEFWCQFCGEFYQRCAVICLSDPSGQSAAHEELLQTNCTPFFVPKRNAVIESAHKLHRQASGLFRTFTKNPYWSR
jgi:hypothetical protein